MDQPLKKPEFIKIKDIEPAKHCYHVYGKIVSSNHSEIVTNNGKVVKIVEGVIGDETGSANFKFSGNHATQIQTGKIVALRNGKSNIIDERIILELDQFGRVTEEKDVKIGNVDSQNNISNIKWEKKKK